MTIEIITEEGYLLTSFELESNPFKVGEVIFIDVNVNKNSKWDIKELKCECRIDNIEHYFRKSYMMGASSSSFSVSVEVTVLDKRQ